MTRSRWQEGKSEAAAQAEEVEEENDEEIESIEVLFVDQV